LVLRLLRLLLLRRGSGLDGSSGLGARARRLRLRVGGSLGSLGSLGSSGRGGRGGLRPPAGALERIGVLRGALGSRGHARGYRVGARGYLRGFRLSSLHLGERGPGLVGRSGVPGAHERIGVLRGALGSRGHARGYRVGARGFLRGFRLSSPQLDERGVGCLGCQQLLLLGCQQLLVLRRRLRLRLRRVISKSRPNHLAHDLVPELHRERHPTSPRELLLKQRVSVAPNLFRSDADAGGPARSNLRSEP
jgi:hypothetical protein